MIYTKNFYDMLINIIISINMSHNEKSELEYYKIRKPLSACKDKKQNFFT